jgi:hypothetical protein
MSIGSECRAKACAYPHNRKVKAVSKEEAKQRAFEVWFVHGPTLANIKCTAFVYCCCVLLLCTAAAAAAAAAVHPWHRSNASTCYDQLHQAVSTGHSQLAP